MGRVKGRVTIADVAKHAGVSTTTISRFLNGKFEFMSEESQQKIKTVIEELNYRPSNLARSLRLSKSKLIGVIIADIASPISSILVKGISDQCKKLGYQVVIANTDNDHQKEQEYILSMIDQRVEGLIVHTSGNNNEFLLDISRNYVPIVLVDRPTFPTAFDTVKTNDYQATLDAIHYLVNEGFRKVAFFTEPIGNIGTRILRLQAYQKACEDIYLEPQIYEVDVADAKKVQMKVQEYADREPEVAKAIFTANGVIMLNALSAINQLRLGIPDDMGICGFDDWPWAALIGPGITAISQPSYEVGAVCVKRMIYRLECNKTSKPKIIELSSRLIVRGSTKLQR